MTVYIERVSGSTEPVEGQILVTVGDGQPGNDEAGFYGWESLIGSIDPNPPIINEEEIIGIIWNPVDFSGITGLWDITFETDALPQNTWETVSIETSTGTIQFNSADATFFTDAFTGTKWRFEWDDVNRWGEDDEGIVRVVTFTVPEPV